MDKRFALIVHGGAWNIPESLWGAHREGVRLAAECGVGVLEKGGCALDAVESAIRLMEDNPVFDAGLGSVLNEAGCVQMDAGIMCGETLQVGAVGAIETSRSAILAARKVLEDPRAVFLVGPGADDFARRQGVEQVEREALVTPVERARFLQCQTMEQEELIRFLRDDMAGDTVGAIALDLEGHMAAGNSTGGTTFKYAGRVGDSPLPGCGLLADDWVGGVCCTGWGEYIIRSTLAARVSAMMASGIPPETAAQAALSHLSSRIGGQAGLICMNTRGVVGAAHVTPRMAWTAFDAEGRWSGAE